MNNKRAYRLLYVAVVVLVVIAMLFFVTMREPNGSKDNSENHHAGDSREREQGKKPEPAKEEKHRRAIEYKKKLRADTEKRRKKIEKASEQLLFSRKIKKYQFDVPEPSYTNANINSGQMFVYGQYLPPPYRVEILGERLLVNGIPLIPGLYADIYSDVQVTEDDVKKHEASKTVCKMVGQTNFDNPEEIEKLLQALKELDEVDEVMLDKGMKGTIWIKYKGKQFWTGTSTYTSMPSLSEDERKKSLKDSIKSTKRRIEKKLKANGVIFWFSKGQLWGGMTADEVQILAREIDKILVNTKPDPERLVSDFADEVRQIKKITSRFKDPQIIEIVANWKRK